MNIIEFDALLFEIASLIKSFKTQRQINNPVLFIIENDLKNLVSAYVTVRTYLFLNDLGYGAKTNLRTVDDFNLLLAKCQPARSASIGLIGEKLKDAAIKLNTFIEAFAKRTPLEQVKSSRLLSGIFVPLILLQSNYRQLIFSIFTEFKPHQQGLNLFIVGSQALTLLLFTLIKNKEEGKILYWILSNRDLDLRITLPPTVTDKQFGEYSSKLRTILQKSYPGMLEHSNVRQRYCTFTFTRDSLKFDVVLTTRTQVMSNFSIRIPVANTAPNQFIDYSFFTGHAKKEATIYNLEEHIVARDINALVFIKKHLEFLELLKLRIPPHQAAAWQNMPAELNSLIETEYNRKYKQQVSTDTATSTAAVTPPCKFDLDQFPLLHARSQKPKSSPSEEEKTRPRAGRL